MDAAASTATSAIVAGFDVTAWRWFESDEGVWELKLPEIVALQTGLESVQFFQLAVGAQPRDQ